MKILFVLGGTCMGAGIICVLMFLQALSGRCPDYRYINDFTDIIDFLLSLLFLFPIPVLVFAIVASWVSLFKDFHALSGTGKAMVYALAIALTVPIVLITCQAS